MERPLFLRFLPKTLQQILYYRYYHSRCSEYLPLYDRAALAFARRVHMRGLIPGDVISGNIAFNGFYELALSQVIRRLAADGGTLVDVGANMGYFSLLWVDASASARAITFEAAPRNIDLIAWNVRENGLADRIRQISKAAGKSTGVATFELGPTTQTGWGGIAASRSQTTIDVPMVRIDEELSGETIDVLKIDVEGADTWVIFGCETLLRQKRIRHIFFEQNFERMRLLGIKDFEARDFLTDLGYECCPLGKADNEWHAYPRDSSASS